MHTEKLSFVFSFKNKMCKGLNTYGPVGRTVQKELEDVPMGMGFEVPKAYPIPS